MSKYRIEEVSDLDTWNVFVEQSPQGTMFSYSAYLDLAVDYWKIYWIKKGNQVKAGLVLVLNESNDKILLDDLVIYNGLIFALDTEQKVAKARSASFEITEFVIAWLTKNFQYIELSLSPQIEDMRPYLWHNYDSDKQCDRFSLNLRYTSYLDIRSINSSKEEDTSLFGELETLRKRNIREARKAGVKTVITENTELFIQNYMAMMNAKGEVQSDDKLKRLERLINGLIEKQLANIYLTQDKNGNDIYISVFGWDNKRAYYLFGATVEGVTERYRGTISFWDAFLDLSKKGLYEVDLEGVNSPQRGWYKLSFGGRLVTYYEVKK